MAFTEEGAPVRESYVNLIPPAQAARTKAACATACSTPSRASSSCTAWLPKGVKLLPEDVFARASYVLSAKVLDPQFQARSRSA